MSLSRKEYDSASSFYSAAMQIIEGVGGEKSAELRRRCCLTLAECDIKTGKHLQAIARCSEVIEEAPDINYDINDTNEDINKNKMKYEKLKQALGKAYFRRGLSLQLLEKPQLALLDMRKGLEITPSDPRFLRHISIIEKMIESNDDNKNQVNPEEELQDIIEEAQYKHPRQRFSASQISSLISQKKVNAASEVSKPFDFQSMLSQGQGLGALGNSDGGGLDSLLGSGGLGGLGGLLGGGGIGSLLGGGGLGSLLGGGGLGGIGTLLSGMGVDATLVTQIGEIFTACKDVFKQFKNAYEYMNKNSNHITTGLTIVWITLTARTIYQQR